MDVVLGRPSHVELFQKVTGTGNSHTLPCRHTLGSTEPEKGQERKHEKKRTGMQFG